MGAMRREDLLQKLRDFKVSCLNDLRYREFLSAFQEYERRYRPCES